ncbi:hypothetical protein J132_03130 [Termitomyces sp. J132]|nr:hypothetical protein J132_03130 [Termitomyces sp. J132]
MGKRKLVPTALHSELTGYSSLIRALRANNTLDVTSHLAKASFNLDSKSDINLTDSDTHEEDFQHKSTDAEDEYDTDAMTNADPPMSSALHLVSSPTAKWSFEDEIRYLAEHISKHQSQTLFPPQEAEKDGENPDDLVSEDIDDVGPSYLPHLTQAASNYLSTILALLVAHTPNRPDSQQNRIEPMCWRALLDVLSSCGDPNVADLKMLSSVEMRMESLYRNPEEPVSDSLGKFLEHRIRSSLSAKQKLKAELSSPLDSLLSFPETPEGWIPPRPARLSLRKARKALAKTPAYIEDEDP